MADTRDFEKGCKVIYSDAVVRGPYLRKDGRKHVCLLYKNGKRTTVSYPKYLVEVHLGRYLEAWETVDHIDGDFTNDDLSNLRILERRSHCKIDALRYPLQEFQCPVCKEFFFLSGAKISRIARERNRNKSNTGPYCSKKCAGIKSHHKSPLPSLTSFKSLNKE
jgi:hypothetical protein